MFSPVSALLTTCLIFKMVYLMLLLLSAIMSWFTFSNPYCNAKDRLDTFACHRWSAASRKTAYFNPVQTANAGFYYIGQEMYLKCFACGMIVDGETLFGKPAAIEHAMKNPQCPFVQDLECGNIAIGDSPYDKEKKQIRKITEPCC